MPTLSSNRETPFSPLVAAWFRLARLATEGMLCFVLPVSTLVFLITGPHAWDAALSWTLPIWLCIAADYFSPADRDTPRTDGLEWLLDARLYVLFGLQLGNIALLLDVASRLRWDSPAEFATGAANIAAMRVLVGATSCCSAIAVAHELIHRRPKFQRQMGRILLWTVCYDHFAVEHARGHHRLAAIPADPVTAGYGESFRVFLRRSLRGQWGNAWRFENRRLRGLPGLERLAHHRVLHGILIELVLLGLIFVYFGWVALLMFLYQAWVAVRMLEAVNYIQHWGLVRLRADFGPADAWSTDSWFTLHAFIGLSRHADHHAHAGKPCYRLRYREEGPRLPHGYFVMVLMVRLCNGRYLELAGRELQARKLGPFRYERT